MGAAGPRLGHRVTVSTLRCSAVHCALRGLNKRAISERRHAQGLLLSTVGPSGSCCTCPGRPPGQVRAVDVGMNGVVKLKYGDREGLTRLINNQLHIPTIEGLFGLSSVDVEGIAEPADDTGFTFTTYLSGSTLQISGVPAAGGGQLVQQVRDEGMTPLTQSDPQSKKRKKNS